MVSRSQQGKFSRAFAALERNLGLGHSFPWSGWAEIFVFLYLLYMYPGFYSYTEGATCKILDLLLETIHI